jgi:hypothetical protein
VQKIEIKALVVLLLVCTLLLALFQVGESIDPTFELGQKNKILSLEYKAVCETYDKMKGIEVESTNTYYCSPSKLRIETSSEAKGVEIEIYDGRRHSHYDSFSKYYKSDVSFLKRPPLPGVIDKGTILDKILKSKEYEFYGYEEKDEKIFCVIGVTKETEGHVLLNKYWFEKAYNTNLIYKEENFIDNTVVSKTTYIYLKINDQIDKKLFTIP